MAPRRSDRLALAAASVATVGWMLILGTILWWELQPAKTTQVQEPIEILNPRNEVPIGQPIVLRLVVDKPQGITTEQAQRFLECQSGNLVTLTASARDLPPGQYTIVSDSVILPAKVAPGDICVFVFRNTYRLNPIRTETAQWTSEPFLVLPPVEDDDVDG